MKLFLLICLTSICAVFAHADIKSTSGNISFDVDSNDSTDFLIDSNGLGIGTLTPTSNLHVYGNAIIENGNFGIGMTATNSTLEIQGTLAFSPESISANTTLSGNSFLMCDTSSDNITITLPEAAGVNGRHYLIKKISHDNLLRVETSSGNIDSGNSLTLNSYATGGNNDIILPFVGVVSDGAKWQLTQSSRHNFNGLIGWYKLDESSGNTAYDSSGLNNHGTLDGGVTFDANSVTGKLKTALDFDGSGDRVDFGNLTQMSSIPEITLSLWMNPASIDVTDRVVHREVDGDSNVKIYTHSNGLMYFEVRDNTSRHGHFDYSSAVGAGTWHHLAMVFKGSGASDSEVLSVYVDGVRINLDYTGAGFASKTPDMSSTNLLIAAESNGSLPFQGKFDDFRIYNRALNAQEISNLYQLGD